MLVNDSVDALSPGDTALRSIVEAATLAPSGDNCQPWTFSWDGNRLAIYFDSARGAAFLDVNNVASWISLGATLTNIEVAAAHAGFVTRASVNLHEQPALPVVLVSFSPGRHDDAGLFAAISLRQTNRNRFEKTPIPDNVVWDLQRLAEKTPGASLDVVQDAGNKSRIAELAASFDPLLFEHKEIHDGLYRWIRWNAREHETTNDGMPVSTLGVNGAESFALRLLGFWRLCRIMARIGFTRTFAPAARKKYECAGAFALLSVMGRAPDDFVRGGEALERVWLGATDRGLSFQPTTGMTFLRHRMTLAGGAGLSDQQKKTTERFSRDISSIFRNFSDKTPVMLFRIGIARRPAPRARRRPLNEVFRNESDSKKHG